MDSLAILSGGGAAVLAGLVIIFQFTTELFMARHYVLAMVFFTRVILLMTQLAVPADPCILITERAVETLVDAATGILVIVLVRRHPPFAFPPAASAGARPGGS